MPLLAGGILFFLTTEYICCMQWSRIPIDEFLSASKNHILLDVRSPSEYAHAHIPGAISQPLFTDEERKIVGTTYKQQSRELAIKTGLDFFGPKMRGIVEAVEALCEKQPALPGERNAVFIYCWRGGMRSAAISWLLSLYGFKIYTLAGGYKAFRNRVLRTFEEPFKLKLLGGYTGSGKTLVLKELKKAGERVIDLENMVCHKGSAFGNLVDPQKQPTQEMFENLLATELRELIAENGGQPPTVWVEDESQRIGNLNIPSGFWSSMRISPVYFLEVPFEKRLNYIVEDYGCSPVEKLIESTVRIEKRLGGLETKNVLQFLEEGNLREAFRILLFYYDKRYLKGLHNRENIRSLLTIISCENVSPLNCQALLNQYQTL